MSTDAFLFSIFKTKALRHVAWGALQVKLDFAKEEEWVSSFSAWYTNDFNK